MIIVVTHRSNYEMFRECIKSLNGCKYPITIVVNDVENTSQEFLQKRYLLLPYPVILNYKDGFELGALKASLKYTDAEEFFILQDSTIVKDLQIFDTIFNTKGSVTVAEGYLQYLGKYRREILNKLTIPDVYTKMESVSYESKFNREYIRIEEPVILDRFFGFTSYEGKRMEEKFGRLNQVHENNYFIKYKGTWCLTMI